MRLDPLRNKRKRIMCPHPLTTNWQLYMHLHPVINERLLASFRSLKIHHVLAFFGGFFLSTNHGRRFASPLTHTWLIENEVLACPHHFVMIERGEGETASLSIILLTTIVR